MIVDAFLILFIISFACANLYLIGITTILIIEGRPREWLYKKRRESFKIIDGGKK